MEVKNLCSNDDLNHFIIIYNVDYSNILNYLSRLKVFVNVLILVDKLKHYLTHQDKDFYLFISNIVISMVILFNNNLYDDYFN